MTEQEYRADTEYINQSLLKEFKPWFMHGTPEKFRKKEEGESSVALGFGSILHKCLENPDNLEKVIAKPQTNLSDAKQRVMKAGYTIDSFARNSTSKAAKAYLKDIATAEQIEELESKVEDIREEGKAFEAELKGLVNEGYLILDESEYGSASYNKGLLQELVMEVETHPWIKYMRENYHTENEKIVMAKTDYGNLKSMMDVYAEDDKTANIIDYKTYREMFFSSAIRGHDLMYQASFYANLLHLSDVTDKTLDKIHFFFIAISKKFRSVHIVEIPGESLITVFKSNFHYPISSDQWGNHMLVSSNPGPNYSAVKNPSIINLLNAFQEWQGREQNASGSLVI